jgi:hypothetical protein
MSELLATVREAVAALAAADPARRRFGAAHHRYALGPAIAPAALEAVEAALRAALPDDLRAFVLAVGDGGAGPGYGLVPVALAAPYVVRVEPRAFARSPSVVGVAAPSGGAEPGAHTRAEPGAQTRFEPPWSRALPLAHLGCGYAAVVALDGPGRGEIWVDARAAGVLRPIAPSFTAAYLDWIDRLAHARWPEPPVPPGRCALAGALSGYLAHCEAEQGVSPGDLAGSALRDALGRLGPGAIEVAADSAIAWFTDADRVDPCIACARVLANLADDGLRPDAVAPGAPPIPLR